jgi:hypothetical protein
MVGARFGETPPPWRRRGAAASRLRPAPAAFAGRDLERAAMPCMVQFIMITLLALLVSCALL